MAFTQNTWSLCFPLITEKSLLLGCKYVRDLRSLLLRFLACDLSLSGHRGEPPLIPQAPSAVAITEYIKQTHCKYLGPAQRAPI